MHPMSNAPLSSFTSFGVGGPAERLYTCISGDQLQNVLSLVKHDQTWILGYGANVLISDTGLPGTTIRIQTSTIARTVDSNEIIADAGVWWDDLVQYAHLENLWGLELMSGIPGSVGAAVVGNIAAYGQAIADTLQWVEVFDPTTQETRVLRSNQLGLTYRYSQFQSEALRHLLILRAAFTLGSQSVTDVSYQSALDIAAQYSYDLATLAGRRQTILETRRLAGSLWDYRSPQTQIHTAGSFFRNPMVDPEAADMIMGFDETGRSVELLKQMNLVHGGEQKRVSAAHVLLAAGFKRGQAWGHVRLHPDHILKIENTGGATAQDIYDVAMKIKQTVLEKLGVELQPEVRFLGKFNN
jgi:UDP-N-acetylmuramate dehydrogenase